MRIPPSASRTLRKVFFFLHLWFGVVLGVWFIAVGLSGSVLAWLPEMIRYEMKAKFYDSPQASGAHITLTDAVKSFRAAYPDAPDPEHVITPNFRFPVYMVFQRKLGSVPIDPYTGTVGKSFDKPDLIAGKISNFHGDLLLGAKGLVFNGIASIAGVILLLSGLWLWWPSTWRQLKIRLSVKRKVSFRRLVMDLHNVTGIYLFLILFVTTWTSAMLVFHDKVEDALGGVAEHAHLTVTPPSPNAQPLSDNELVKIAQEIFPDKDMLGVGRSLKPDMPFHADFGSQTGIAGGVEVQIDPYTGKVLEIDYVSKSEKAQKVMAWTTDLHYGFFGGITTQLLYTLAGLMPLFLTVTGLFMWWKRKQSEWKSAERKRKKAAAAAS